MKKVIALLLAAALLTLCGCEAVKGFGKDMQKAGDWMEKEASKHQ